MSLSFLDTGKCPDDMMKVYKLTNMITLTQGIVMHILRSWTWLLKLSAVLIIKILKLWSELTLLTLKTFLRTTMSERRLNNLFVLYVHKSATDTLDLNSIAKEFVSINSKRMRYFGNF